MPSTATSVSSCWVWPSRESRRNRLTFFASASSSGRLECCKRRSIRRLGGSPRFLRRQMTELFASESFRPKYRTRTRRFLAAWPDMLEFFRRQRMSQFLVRLCLAGEPQFCGLTLSRYSLGENSRPPERRVPWDGIRHPLRRSPANIFLHRHTDISVIPAHPCGLTRSASY